MTERGTGLRWGVEQRLEFIEFRLFWEGGINRSDIMEVFGVSVPQASKDLSQYKELAQDNVHYDLSKKRYLATESFEPLFLAPDADRYLAELSLTAPPTSSREHSWLAGPQRADTMPIPHRRVDAQILRLILAAARKGLSAEVLYQSMNEQRPEPLWRRITPHAFGSDGFRWHVRSFCHIRQEFRDFLLSRCLEARHSDEPAADPQQDRKWFEYLNVVLTPNPKLGDCQRKIIAQDYAMTDGCVVVPVRCALLYYFKKRLRLDVAEYLDNPNETPVVIMNITEVELALSDSKH